MEETRGVKVLQAVAETQAKTIKVLSGVLHQLEQRVQDTIEQQGTSHLGSPLSARVSLEAPVTQKRPVLKDLFESLDQFVKHERSTGKGYPIGLGPPIIEDLPINSLRLGDGCYLSRPSHGKSVSPSLLSRQAIPCNRSMPSQQKGKRIPATLKQRRENLNAIRSPAHPPQQRKRKFSDLGMPLSQALQILIKRGKLEPLTPSPPPNPLPSYYRTSEFCTFHQNHGHDTDRCHRLRHEIQNLIDKKVIFASRLSPYSIPLPNSINHLTTLPPPKNLTHFIVPASWPRPVVQVKEVAVPDEGFRNMPYWKEVKAPEVICARGKKENVRATSKAISGPKSI